MKKHDSSTAMKVILSAYEGIKLIDQCSCALDDFLDKKLKHQELRRTISDLLFNTFRRRKQLQSWIDVNSVKKPKAEVNQFILVALSQCLFQNSIAPESAVNVAVCESKRMFGDGIGNFVNALLRNARRNVPVFSNNYEAVIPEKLLLHWEKNFEKEELQQIAESLLTEVPITFRAIKNSTLSLDFEYEKINGYANFDFYKTKFASKLLNSEDFINGKIYIQDPATSMSIELIKTWDDIQNVLDVCGAPGGKALMMSEKISESATLQINDLSAKRQRLTIENMKKFKLKHDITVLDISEINKKYDLVFLDVPCSNTGVFRRRPDALWRFSNEALNSVVDKQSEILQEAKKLVMPNGKLLYSTCSIEPEENSLQIKSFLENNKDFVILEERQLLPSNTEDGAYACLMMRCESL